jgi:hypothetical protein
MAATATVLKMLKGTSKRRTYEDFPEWVSACAKLREVASEHDALVDRQKSIIGTLNDINRRRNAAVDIAVKARLEGQTSKQAAALVEDRDQLEFEMRVARDVLARQSDIVHEIDGRCAAEILNEVRPAHEQLVRNTRAALLALADALDAENQFISDLARDRVSGLSDLPSIPHRIRQAVGSRSRWSSGVNDGDRIISAYLGEAWDHSRVTS